MELLKKLWAGWTAFGKTIGDIVGRVLLTVFYFTVFVPFGLGSRFLGDRLDIKAWRQNNGSKSSWVSRSTTDLDVDDARGQS